MHVFSTKDMLVAQYSYNILPYIGPEATDVYIPKLFMGEGGGLNSENLKFSGGFLFSIFSYVFLRVVFVGQVNRTKGDLLSCASSYRQPLQRL